MFAAKQDPQHTPTFQQGDDQFDLYYAGCNGRFFGPRAFWLGRASVLRHGWAGYRARSASTVTAAPKIAGSGDLLVTATGGVTVGVMDIGGLDANVSTVVDGVEVLVTWTASKTTLAAHRDGAVALSFVLPPGAVLYAYHM